MQLSWIIVGGGIHGVHLATRLIGEARVPAEQVRIIDPAERLLTRWRACTAVTGMTHLRSPSVHHLAVHPLDLRQYARQNPAPDQYTAPYDRPSLALFDEHCDQVIERWGLDALHVQAWATGGTVDCDGVTVELSTGDTLQAQNVILAVGASEQLRWPTWAPRDHARVEHIFAPGFELPPAPARVAVVGGGISAGQVALRLVDEGHTVHGIARHALRTHQFDSDPGWLGPRHMRDFQEIDDLGARRSVITAARHSGSVTPGVAAALQAAADAQSLTWHKADVVALEASDDSVHLHLATGAVLEVDRVLCATGFEATRPGGALVDRLIESARLPCAGCGYPVVDAGLRWHPRIRVSGPLAELELGPAARNIAGARRAADRVLAALG